MKEVRAKLKEPSKNSIYKVRRNCMYNMSLQREMWRHKLTSMTWNSHSLVSYDVSFGLYTERDKVINNTREWRGLATLHTQYYDPVTHRPSPLPLYTLLQLNIADFRDFSSTPPGDCVCNTFCAGKVVSMVYLGDKRERKSKEDRKRVIVYTLCKGSAGRERKKGCGPCTRWQWFPWPPCRAKWRRLLWGCLETPATVFAGVCSIGSSKREQYIN